MTMQIEVGKSYRINYGVGNINNKLIHVRGIVDGDIVVYREWWKSKKYWRYFVNDMLYFDMLFWDGIMKEAK